jgi:urocanate hydratase
MTFKEKIEQGIPDVLPVHRAFEISINHAPKRKEILSKLDTELALRNALRYFEKKHHEELLPEFAEELKIYGRIYMHRFRPSYEMYA